ncbi:MAG: glycosyltransferase [Candidatus Micrarchaeota archaeon]|nr:glycosyltransferase [Candidatus Micrarchaeota archaeon]
MKVSVIIPTLNEEKNIKKSLSSIRRQKFSGEFEIIVADGGSEDKTVEIARKYADKIVTEHTRTIAAGRQAGAMVAEGEIYVYTDADAVVQKNWLENIVKPFEDKNVVAAYGWIVPLKGHSLEVFILKYLALIVAYLSSIIGLDYLAGSNMALRASAFKRVGGMNIHLTTGEDIDIIKRVRKLGKVVFVPEAVVKYSMRRIRNWGYRKYFLFHAKNYFMTHFFNKSASEYEPIR